MTNIVIPFNHQPESVSVKTSSYTIPSGKYAFVTGNVRDAGNMSIDGEICLSCATDTLKVSASINTVSLTGGLNTATSYVVPSGHTFEGQLYAYGATSGTVTIGGVNVHTGISSGALLTGIKAGSGDTITIGANTSCTSTITGFAKKDGMAGIQETGTTGSFWVPAGTVISGSGSWRAAVALYSEIT